MKLPIQAPPVDRMAESSLVMQFSTSGIMPSRKQQITGRCVCRRGKSVLWVADSTVCANPTHDNCTSAKAACVASYGARCRAEGGIISQSGDSCNVGANC